MNSKLLLCILASWMTIFVYGQSLGDYRSKQSGNWNLTTTWERFDGTNWVNATVVPSSTDAVITITSTHQVTVSDARNADQVIVSTGATLTINVTSPFGAFTLNDGADYDLSVDGALNISGTVTGMK
jgi:hypothetical protein